MLFNRLTIGAVAAIAALLPSIAGATPSFPRGLGGPPGSPKSCDEWRHQHPYHHPPTDKRHKVYIRASKTETDDISADFLKGLKEANHGGTLVLPKGKTYVIGKKLDLTFLKDVEVQLDGTILVCSHSEPTPKLG
jgi:galacturan 1,4-alpha-galacturonidase